MKAITFFIHPYIPHNRSITVTFRYKIFFVISLVIVIFSLIKILIESYYFFQSIVEAILVATTGNTQETIAFHSPTFSPTQYIDWFSLGVIVLFLIIGSVIPSLVYFFLFSHQEKKHKAHHTHYRHSEKHHHRHLR